MRARSPTLRSKYCTLPSGLPVSPLSKEGEYDRKMTPGVKLSTMPSGMSMPPPISKPVDWSYDSSTSVSSSWWKRTPPRTHGLKPTSPGMGGAILAPATNPWSTYSASTPSTSVLKE